MNQSESIAELAKALSIAQSKIEPAVKDSNNPFFKYSYADLDSCWSAIRKHLTDNGLSITQGCRFTEHWTLVTKLLHVSGQWIEFEMPLFMKDQTSQSAGSSITYGRRYSLAAIVGLTQADDDGEQNRKRHEEVSHVAQDKPRQAVSPILKKELVSEAQAKRLYAIARQSGYSAGELAVELNKKWGFADSRAVWKEKYDDIVEYFQKPVRAPKKAEMKEEDAPEIDQDIPF